MTTGFGAAAKGVEEGPTGAAGGFLRRGGAVATVGVATFGEGAVELAGVACELLGEVGGVGKVVAVGVVVDVVEAVVDGSLGAEEPGEALEMAGEGAGALEAGDVEGKGATPGVVPTEGTEQLPPRVTAPTKGEGGVKLSGYQVAVALSVTVPVVELGSHCEIVAVEADAPWGVSAIGTLVVDRVERPPVTESTVAVSSSGKSLEIVQVMWYSAVVGLASHVATPTTVSAWAEAIVGMPKTPAPAAVAAAPISSHRIFNCCLQD